ncbi:MAG: hypothetical protein Q8P84_01270 [Deltaproteobacteria bacterium]|nr:hypothetical protein [Deltaproteobacteria bacterium]
MPLKNLNNFQKALKEAAKEKNKARRGIRIAALIAEALRQIGEDPILVGGAAVEFYTEGDYTTKDIDMVAVGGAPLWNVMEQLGFVRHGKDFIHEMLKIYIEFPSEKLNPSEQSDLLDVDGLPLKIISIEDLIVDRLCSYKFWKSSVDGLAALLLLELGRADTKRLQLQAKHREVDDALQILTRLYEEIYRKKLSKTEASAKLKDWLRSS